MFDGEGNSSVHSHSHPPRPNAPTPPSHSPSIFLPAALPSTSSTESPYRTPHHSFSTSDISKFELEHFVWNPTSAINSPNISPHRQRGPLKSTPPRQSVHSNASTVEPGKICFPRLPKQPRGFPYANATVLDGSPASVERWRRDGTQEGDEDVDLDLTGDYPASRPNVSVRLTYGEQDTGQFEEEEIGKLRSFVFPTPPMSGLEEGRSSSVPTSANWQGMWDDGIDVVDFGAIIGKTNVSSDDPPIDESQSQGWVYAPTKPLSVSPQPPLSPHSDNGMLNNKRKSTTWTLSSLLNGKHSVIPGSASQDQSQRTPSPNSPNFYPKAPSTASSNQTPLTPFFSPVPEGMESNFSSSPMTPDLSREANTSATSQWGSFGSIMGIPWIGKRSAANPEREDYDEVNHEVEHVGYSQNEEAHRRRRWEKSAAPWTEVDDSKPHVNREKGVRFDNLVQVERNLVEQRGFTLIGMEDVESLKETQERGGRIPFQRRSDSLSHLRKRPSSVKIMLPPQDARLSIAAYLERSVSLASSATSQEESKEFGKRKTRRTSSRRLSRRIWRTNRRESRVSYYHQGESGLWCRIENEANFPQICFYLGFIFPWFWLFGAFYLRNHILPVPRDLTRPANLKKYVIACRIASAVASVALATVISISVLVGLRRL